LKRTLYHLLSLLIIIPLGLYSKIYNGPAATWVNNSSGGILYVLCFIIFFSLLLRQSKPFKLSLIVFLATCGVEFLQLWHPPFLTMLRSNRIGVTFLGNSFGWSDFPYYLIGAVIGYFWMRRIPK